MSHPIKILGITNEGRFILGGFFAAHDSYGLHTSWFMSMFLEKFDVSIPYFACEILQHADHNPDLIWQLLREGYGDAGRSLEWDEQERNLHSFLAMKWVDYGKPSLQSMAKSIMHEMEQVGSSLDAFIPEIQRHSLTA
jgi:hypothetical protein